MAGKSCLILLVAVLLGATCKAQARTLAQTATEQITSCAPGSPRFMCTIDSWNACNNATCAADPRASCIVKPCWVVFRGTTLNACTPIWYNAATGDLVNCTAVHPPPSPSRAACIASCPKKGATEVCGKNGKTYPSKCVADCLHKAIARKGKCKNR